MPIAFASQRDLTGFFLNLSVIIDISYLDRNFVKEDIMNFKVFEYIIAVNKYKNFTKAAEKCGITQATMSARIKTSKIN